VLGQSDHTSCLVVTSREAPAELTALGGERSGVYAVDLGGLSVEEGQALLSDKRLRGDGVTWATLVAHYGGNGLALKIVGESINPVFGGDITAFLEQAGSSSVFGGIRRLLDRQIERLSDLEQEVLGWLAIERDPVTFGELVADIGARVGRGDVLEAVEALRRRSLVERTEPGAAFTLQSVILEYVTDRLVEQVADEIEHNQPRLLLSHALMKATAKDYTRRSQERLLIQPLINHLVARFGTAGHSGTAGHRAAGTNP
jgi:hypothetical protein